MNKNGFTLVELLAAVVIISIITLMGSIGIAAAKRGINKSLWNTNIELIEAAGESFGNDKKEYIKNLDPNAHSCEINSKKIAPCLTIKVQTLIDRNYLNTKETIEYNEVKNYKVIINKTIDKAQVTVPSDEEKNFVSGYYANREKVYVYVENDIVYAKYSGIIAEN